MNGTQSDDHLTASDGSRHLVLAGRRVMFRRYERIEKMSFRADAQAGVLIQAISALVRDTGDAQRAAAELPKIVAIAAHVVPLKWMIAVQITPLETDDPEQFFAECKESARWVCALSNLRLAALTLAWYWENIDLFNASLAARTPATEALHLLQTMPVAGSA